MSKKISNQGIALWFAIKIFDIHDQCVHTCQYDHIVYKVFLGRVWVLDSEDRKVQEGLMWK